MPAMPSPAPRSQWRQSLVFLPVAHSESGESLPLDLPLASTSPSAEPTQLVASLENADSAPELCCESLGDVTGAFARSANEVGMEPGSTMVPERPPAVARALIGGAALDEPDLETTADARSTMDLHAASALEGASERDAPALACRAFGLPIACARTPEASVAPNESASLPPLVEPRLGGISELEQAA